MLMEWSFRKPIICFRTSVTRSVNRDFLKIGPYTKASITLDIFDGDENANHSAITSGTVDEGFDF